jgi:preprotein translocase subunit SecA
LYAKLAGMTGTADTEAFEFSEIYGLETTIIPPNRASKREDQLDRVYKTTREKYEAAIKDIRECYERGQPVLVGTTSIENSEIIDELLNKENLPHQVLNAKQHAREADIVAQAGRPKMITIATNMAGRGTDIVLGGNVEKRIEVVEADETPDSAAKEKEIARLRAEWAVEHEQVIAAGGLRIIATERHESRRIDNQLRGRSGRQGDNGSSRFYLSLDDSLMRIFAGERVKAIMDRLKMPDGEAIEAGIVSRSIESAQRKVEARNFDIRKQLLEYDDVSNDQRKVIYQQRNDIMDAASLTSQIASLREGCFTDLTRQYVPVESVEEQWDIAGLEKVLASEWQMDLSLAKDIEGAAAVTDEDVLEKVLAAAHVAFAAKLEQIGEENFLQFERMVLLQSIDTHWREHLSALDYLRQGIHLRGYAQKQPKQEYKREAFELFGQLLDSVKNEVTKTLMTVKIQSSQELNQAAEAIENRGENIANVTYTAPTETGDVDVRRDEATQAQALPPEVMQRTGRNDPCPCGSGKKFKQCHGKLS